MSFRCLVVEDQLMIQQLLVSMLEAHPALAIVGSACSVTEGIAACQKFLPDLVILDLALPDGDGLSVAQALRDIHPAARVIVLSSFASTAERPAELRDQIVAIIDKGRACQDLINAIEAVLPPEGLNNQKPKNQIDRLTNRERQILMQIGRGLSSRAIAELLGISVRTVETHRRNICTKLELSGASLIHQATLLQQRCAENTQR